MKGRDSGVLIRLVAALLAAALLALPHQAVRAGGGGIVRYVKPGGLKSGSCLTWGTACELRYALGSVAGLGDNIWAARGTYKPAAGTNRAATFTLKTGVQIYGGFAGTETSFSQRNIKKNISILSGDIGVLGNPDDNSYNVVYAGAVDSTAVLDGFQIVGGRANYGISQTGGGMVVSGSPTLRHLRFINNYAGFTGGAMYVISGSQAALTDVSFENNSAYAYYGGAMYVNASSPVLTNVTFSGNTAGTSGGAIASANASSPVLTNVTFSGNTAGAYGGGMYNIDNGTNPSLTNVTFSGNSAGVSGGAIYNDTSSASYIYDSVLWGDGATELVNGVWGAASINDSIVQGGCPVSAGTACSAVISASPVLKALQNNGGFAKTRALGPGSAAIDAGNGTTCASRDQRGLIRPQGLGCDMGAYEVKAKTFASQAANDGWILESGEFTEAGGAPHAGGGTLLVGDNDANRQYRSLVSFNTAGLPDGAAIVMGRLWLTRQASTGTDPFSTHGNLIMELAKPYFGSGLALQATDFQTAPTVTPAGTVAEPLFGTLFPGTLNGAARAAVNKTGTTQFRLRFTLDDNDDAGSDYLVFYGGEASTASYRPKLVIYYNP